MKLNSQNYKENLANVRSVAEELKRSRNNTVAQCGKKLNLSVEDVSKGCSEIIDANNTLRIGVVGQVKAGKSSMLNALFFDGDSILPKAATPMTAGLTILRYNEENSIDVEYFNQREWNVFKNQAEDLKARIRDYRAGNTEIQYTDEEIMLQINASEEERSALELINMSSRIGTSKIREKSLIEKIPVIDIIDLQAKLGEYVGADGRFTPLVKSLTINLKDERLKGIDIVDTPGVNDPVLSREMRTREFLRGSHGVLFLSSAGRFFDASDMTFLVDRIGSQGIGDVVVIASKVDDTLMQEGMKYKDNLDGCYEACTGALERQFDQNIAGARNMGWNGHKPALDFCSSVCYSIGHKKTSDLDNVEKHVMERLQDLFPENCGRDGNLNIENKETFLELGKIEGIREDWIDGLFKENKDRIIAAKVNSYFENASSNLTQTIETQANLIKGQIDILNSTDASNLSDKKRTFEKATKDIISKLNTLLSDVDVYLENEKKSIINATFIQTITSLPTKTIPYTGIRETTFWGRDKSFSVQVSVPDETRIVGRLADDVRKAFESVSSRWGKTMGAVKKKLDNDFTKILRDIEDNDKDGKIDINMLKSLVDEAKRNLESKKELIYQPKCEEIVDTISAYIQGVSQIRYRKASEDEYEAKEKVRKNAQNNMDRARRIVKDLMAISNQALDNLIPLSDIKRELRTNGDQFKDSLNSAISDLIKELEVQIKNKEAEISEMERAVEKIKKVI